MRNKPQAIRVLALCTFPLFEGRLANKALIHKLRKIYCGYPHNPHDAILSLVSFPFVFVSWKTRHVSPKKSFLCCVNVRGFSLGSCQFPCKHAPESRIDPRLVSSGPPNALSPRPPLLDHYYKSVCFVHHVFSTFASLFLLQIQEYLFFLTAPFIHSTVLYESETPLYSFHQLPHSFLLLDLSLVRIHSFNSVFPYRTSLSIVLSQCMQL